MTAREFFFDKLEEMFLFLTMVFMVVLIFIQVVGRYVFNSSFVWTEEMARYIHIWQIWIGASYAVRKKAHIKVEIFKKIFRKSIQKLIDGIALLAWFVLAAFLAWKGTEMVMIMIERAQVSPAMRIPMWIPYSAIPLGGLLMSIRLIQQMVMLFKDDAFVDSNAEEVVR